jgi:pyridoxal phosphate enzyme (YggS family)
VAIGPIVTAAHGFAELTEAISDRGARLRSLIDSHSDRAVRIVAVTKGHPVEAALAAVAAGFTDLGENYAQELLAKAEAFESPEGLEPPAEMPTWHFIGRLQSNKVRPLVPVVGVWQTVDRASLVEALARRSPGATVLVQVDLAGIPGRGGCPRDEAEALVQRASEVGLDVVGLMGVGTPGPPEDSREGFRWLRAEADRLALREVSMGMSGDLEVALGEGATIVRVGSALLGERPSSRAGLG